MQIEELQLSNWRKYTDQKLSFEGSVVGIVGPNDGGKSTIVDAIRYLLLGATNRVKGRNVRYGCDKGFVKGTFRHGGHTFAISRDILTSRCSLQVGGGEVVKKHDDVNRVLSDMLGVSSAVFNNHVIIQQGKLAAPFEMRLAELSKDFQHLFGTTLCENLRELLQREIFKYPTELYSGDLDKLREEISGLSAQVYQTEASQNEVQGKLSHLSLAETQAIIDAYLQYEEKSKARLQLVERVARAEAALAIDQKALEAVRARLQFLETTISENEESAKTAEDILAQKKQADQLLTVSLSVKRRMDELLSQISELRKTVETPRLSRSEVRRMSDDLSAMEGSRFQLQRAITAFEGVNGAVCPTCRQAVANPEALIQEYKMSSESLYEDIQAITATLRKAEATFREAELAGVKLQSCEAELRGLEKQAAEIPDTAPIVEAQAKWAAEVIDSVADLRRGVVVCQTDLARLQGRIEQGAAVLKADSLRLSELPEVQEVPEESYKRACLDREQHKVLTEQSVTLSSRLSVYYEHRDKLRASLAEAEKRQMEAKRQQEFRKLLERSRHLLHRDNLPRLVAKSHLQRINRDFQNTLDAMDVPFTVSLSEELEFLCETPDGHLVKVSELGGGRKMLLGLAFRLAVNRRFAGDLGLLILDEPTVYVDSDNIESVVDVIDNVRPYVSATNTQLIVVTHEERLKRACDQIIDVNLLEGRVAF